jgi:sugar lactone lactonase YvrE
MNTCRLRDLRAVAVLLSTGLFALAPLSARGQFTSLLQTNSRYAGNSTGTNIYDGDTGAATSTSLNAPSYAVFDSTGNLYVSDTFNNCVRKIDTSGNISTVAGLRVTGVPDTCNTQSNPTPTADQGLLHPTGLAIDSANTLYISDSQHNCIRSLPSGAADTFDANALATVAGTCSNTDTASVTPVPNGLAVDSNGNLYISIQDTTTSTPVNQVLRHLSTDPATTVCYMAGQSSANVPNACAGVIGTVALSSPAGLAFDVNGNLFLADTGNNCIREIAGLTTQQTAVGLCTNDHSGNPATTVHNPYGLAFSPTALLYISESAANNNNVVSFAPGSPTLTLVAGLPNGTPGLYTSLLDGKSSQNAPLNTPLGLTTDASGNVYIADSLNNIIREMNTGLVFPATAVGALSPAQTITFAINQNVNLSTTAGSDYIISSTTCSGFQVPAPGALSPNTCQVSLIFTPSHPGTRSSALQLKDSLSNKIVSVSVTGIGTGSLSMFNPGTVSSLAKNLRSPISVSVDSTGNSYVLEQGDAATTADVLLIPAGGGTPRTIVPEGVGLVTPTAMAVDGAGNIFITDAALSSVSRFGADGSINTSYVTGLSTATGIAVDQQDNLYIAQGGSAHNVIEVYASGTRRILAGSGLTANADGVPASSALFGTPSSVALGPNGLSIADATGHRVYTVDSTGIIHIVAGNGTTTTSAAGQALGTALLNPVGLAADAAGDLFVSDEAANRIYEIYPVASNGLTISSPLGNGAIGYTGDGGPAPLATLQATVAVSLDGAGDLIVVDAGNSAIREVTYPTTAGIDFGDVIIGTTSNPIQQPIANAGNAPLLLTLPFTTTDSQHFAASIDPTSTTCAGTLASGAVCAIGYTFSPSALGSISAQSNLPSNFYNSPQIVRLTGAGIFTQNLPFSLAAESEVYGQPFAETANLSLIYPNLIPTGTMTYSIAGETTCSISGSFPGATNCPAAESGLSVGTYQVKFTFTSGNLNYFSTTGSTTLTITPGTLSVTPALVSMTYGSPIPALTATITGAVNGDLFLSSDTTTATSTSPIGTYPITPTLTGVGLANLANYNVTYNTGKLVITPIPLTVTIGSANRAYGAANPTATSTIAGAINGDTFTVTYSNSATANSGVGTYPITATVAGVNIGNYIVTVVPGILTVTPIPLTVTVANAARPYGTANPVFSSTITGAINDDTFTDNLSTTATLASPIGTYPINDVLTGLAAGNYTVTVVPGTLTVSKATIALTISSNNISRLYGAANPPFTGTVTGALNSDTFTITYATTATATSPIGSYPIVPTVSGTALGNYTLTTTNATLTITPAPLTITANSATRAYGTANPVFASTTTGLVNGDTVTITYATTATTASPVGTYPITATVSGAALSNYALATNDGTLTVTPATLTVAANSATRAYGAANPVFTSTTTGLLNGDTVTIAYATPATAPSPVGTYPIVPTVTGATLSNYTLATTNGTLTITPNAASPLTVTVNNATRMYAAANPVFTSTIAGLLNGDTVTVTYATPATAASPAGSYPITATVSGAAAANYIVNILPGNLTVVPAPTAMTLTTSGSPVLEGTSVTFTATVTSVAPIVPGPVSFLNGSTMLGTGTLNAAGVATFTTSSLTPGTYTIVAVYNSNNDFGSSTASVAQVVIPGTFALTVNPPSAFVRGSSTTTYTVTATSIQNFSGPVTLTCSGLPADATCVFATPTVTLAVGGTATTTMTIVNTAADAKLISPSFRFPSHLKPSDLTPITVAAVFPFELTGLGVFCAGLLRRRKSPQPGSTKAKRIPKMRLTLALLCTAGLIGLTGCACFTSIYQNYTVIITGGSSVQGIQPQTTSVALTVATQ